ncbi:tetratricopeptide repeat protein [Chlamydia gallinacea]|uniref:tetratricopeptide repeat protein n=1 Tax=Chlamydia gallinacea TaxID=1457153 RepID=UPI0023F51B22|nr:tetratricopeptide repeat protein [Chlamydia gallinacea]
MRSLLQLIFALLLVSSSCYAGPISFEPFLGKLSPQKFTPKYSAQDYLSVGIRNLEHQNYHRASLCFRMITHHFPKDPLYSEALYLTGVCYFKRDQPDLANKVFSLYMELPDAKYSEELFSMKLAIAQSFAQGKRKRIFLLEGFPKLMNADEDALRIYDEILAAFPHKDLGAQALYFKGDLLIMRKELAEATKVFKKLTLQFPQHSLSPKAFVRLSEIYLIQAKKEDHNAQYLKLAKMNEEAMRKQHPNHPLNAVASSNVRIMNDLYASGLYHSGRFYEKKKKLRAASIYYTTAVETYPDSPFVAKCLKRLDRIAKHS